MVLSRPPRSTKIRKTGRPRSLKLRLPVPVPLLGHNLHPLLSRPIYATSPDPREDLVQARPDRTPELPSTELDRHLRLKQPRLPGRISDRRDIRRLVPDGLRAPPGRRRGLPRAPNLDLRGRTSCGTCCSSPTAAPGPTSPFPARTHPSTTGSPRVQRRRRPRRRMGVRRGLGAGTSPTSSAAGRYSRGRGCRA